MKTTPAEYATKHGVSVSTARRRLNELVYQGKATQGYQFIHHQPSRLSDIRTPPPTRVAVYTITEE